MHCTFEALCQRYTRDALGLHSGKEHAQTKKGHAFSYNFRLPSVFATPNFGAPAPASASGFKDENHSDDEDGDFVNEEPSFGNLVHDSPNVASARAANATILFDIEKNAKT
jgi:hypothetical protein